VSSVIATVHVVYRTGDAMEVKLVSDVPIGIKANENLILARQVQPDLCRQRLVSGEAEILSLICSAPYFLWQENARPQNCYHPGK